MKPVTTGRVLSPNNGDRRDFIRLSVRALIGVADWKQSSVTIKSTASTGSLCSFRSRKAAENTCTLMRSPSATAEKSASWTKWSWSWSRVDTSLASSPASRRSFQPSRISARRRRLVGPSQYPIPRWERPARRPRTEPEPTSSEPSPFRATRGASLAPRSD